MVFGLLVRGEVAGAIKSRSTRESYHHRRRYRVLHAIQDGLASVLSPKTRRSFLMCRLDEFLAVWKPGPAELGNHSGKRQTKATIMPKGTAMQWHWSNQDRKSVV